MSYILDALKKLEHEKSRKSRGAGMINISGALFENESPRPSGTTGWKIALAVTVAVLVTFSATWYFLQSGKRGGHSSRLATPPPQNLPVKIETVPAPSLPPVVSVQQVPPSGSSKPAQVSTARPRTFYSKSRKAEEQAAAATSEDAAAELSMQKLRTRTNGRKEQTLPADQSIAAQADLKLSGIAWQEERRARRAVVNGFLMQEGGFVSGARITDIYQDRVRFSLSGKSFEIPLVSSGVSAAGK